jgi:uncharacterized membrane protein
MENNGLTRARDGRPGLLVRFARCHVSTAMIFPEHESRTKSVVRMMTAIAMALIGVDHFRHPLPFERIVPPMLPAPHALVLISGFFEVAGGVGLLVPPVRVAAAWGLVALYVSVFPANIYMALHQIQMFDAPMPTWAFWARLPFQALFIANAVWLARTGKPTKV